MRPLGTAPPARAPPAAASAAISWLPRSAPWLRSKAPLALPSSLLAVAVAGVALYLAAYCMQPPSVPVAIDSQALEPSRIHTIRGGLQTIATELQAELSRQCSTQDPSKSSSLDAVLARVKSVLVLAEEAGTDAAVLEQAAHGTMLRRLAVLVAVLALVLPPLLIENVDYLPRLTSLIASGSEPREDGQGEDKEEMAPLSKRLAYRLDFIFSTYSFVKPLALLLATLVLIGIGGLALWGVEDGGQVVEPLHLGEATWRAWTFVADAGNHADTTGLGARIVAVCISFGGMLVFALMLGLVSDAISEKVDSLRKGRSEVVESNHTLILGWSDKLGSLLKQLAIANESMGGGVVVVLAERDKEGMENDINTLEFDFRGTTVICRSGSPLIMVDLKRVSVATARAIIVLAEAENADQSDARAMRVVLSLTGVREGLQGHIVVEISDLDNEQLVKLVGGELVETVVSHDVIGRLMIQCARQPGLAQIWEDLLGFQHAEFYIKEWPQLIGVGFQDVLLSFPDAVPLGVLKKQHKPGGDEGNGSSSLLLNPPDSYVLQPGDRVLVLAEDDDTYAPTTNPASADPGPLPDSTLPPRTPEKFLFCGWRRDIDDMVQVLEAFLAEGSELWMFSEVPEKERDDRLREGGLNTKELKNVKLVHRRGNAVVRRHLEALPLEEFDSILILADEGLEDSVVNADSRSLATLLLIRDIQAKRMPALAARHQLQRRASLGRLRQAEEQPIRTPSGSWMREMQAASTRSIVLSEILDSRTRNLVSVSRISDYVLSNELVSMALAMVAEDKQINLVLQELFAERGSEVYIRPAKLYVHDGDELSFWEVMCRARQRSEVLIGYQRGVEAPPVLNPPNKTAPLRWTMTDSFIVIADH